jgi:hypothetical protein
MSDRGISLAALVISLASAAFTLLQFISSERQLRLNGQQIRPYVSYLPTFFPSPSLQVLKIDMYLQNESPLPANVLFTDVATSVDGKITAHNFYSVHPDILYQQRGGVSTLPLIEGPNFVAIQTAKSKLHLATCAVYTSTSPDDGRRWLIKAVHEYVPDATLPTRLTIAEVEVPNSVGNCDAKSVLKATKLLTPKLPLLLELPSQANGLIK